MALTMASSSARPHREHLLSRVAGRGQSGQQFGQYRVHFGRGANGFVPPTGHRFLGIRCFPRTDFSELLLHQNLMEGKAHWNLSLGKQKPEQPPQE